MVSVHQNSIHHSRIISTFQGDTSDAYIVHKLDTDLINSTVVDSGYVIVEISTSNDLYLWSPCFKKYFLKK